MQTLKIETKNVILDDEIKKAKHKNNFKEDKIPEIEIIKKAKRNSLKNETETEGGAAYNQVL
jgi:hypothetical protein